MNKESSIEHVKGFPPICNDIMIVGTTATSQSKKRGMYYTSGRGGNDIWRVLDYSIEEITKINPGFEDLISEYKKIKLSLEDIEVINNYLDRGYFLVDVKQKFSGNLQKLKEKQCALFALLNKYSIGFCDIVSECNMKDASDKSIQTKKYEGKEFLLNLLANKKAVIFNGVGDTVDFFKAALKIDNAEFAQLKKKLNISCCNSTSGSNRKYLAFTKKQWKDVFTILNENKF